ncbi:hypothetical protein P7K49_026673 [Saguinus oedipus]|uniref:Uncharacterized protein n=1 Tax=Saguinus oedipus TaxID=9490 RepID=A0ABQ9UG41_SAGOE|nr:hypothetical protein P7K49_026673 [Saguinus oedipus]
MVSCPCDVIHVMPPYDVIPLMPSPVIPSLVLGDCDCGVPSAPTGSSQLVVRGGLASVLQQLLLKVPGLLRALDHAIPWTAESSRAQLLVGGRHKSESSASGQTLPEPRIQLPVAWSLCRARVLLRG